MNNFIPCVILFSLRIWHKNDIDVAAAEMHLFHNSTLALVNVNVVVVLPFRTSLFFDLQMVGPALDITLDDLARSVPEVVVNVQQVRLPGLKNCDDLEDAVAVAASQIYYRQNAGETDGSGTVSMWLGPGCTNAVGHLAALARGKLFSWLPNNLFLTIFRTLKNVFSKAKMTASFF